MLATDLQGHPFPQEGPTPETHTTTLATLHDCTTGRWRQMNWNSVRWGKIFCTGPTRAAKAGQKSLVPAPQAQRTYQGRTPFKNRIRGGGGRALRRFLTRNRKQYSLLQECVSVCTDQPPLFHDISFLVLKRTERLVYSRPAREWYHWKTLPTGQPSINVFNVFNLILIF